MTDNLPIGQRVLVKELDVEGWIYEGSLPGQLSSGIERIYGVRLDEVAFPKNFVATIVWHCPFKGLRLLEDE